ncbi:glycosyl transferase family 90 [Caulobacter sp. S45]|uniref:glycosyl transferase family 90 n=1 Tax=Caulobacter sp. S45 TaxID=1641861 RepID=UPI00157696DB|nr:glycosyl transferase family 90 [Caulobacter sp. S45]
MTASASASARTWAELELAPWRGRGLTHQEVSAAIDIAAAEHGALFRYDVRDGRVFCRRKTNDEIGPDANRAIVDMVNRRARTYGELLQASLRRSRVSGNFALGIDVSDLPSSVEGLPLFSFQKRRHAANLLLPDIDLLEFGYFEHAHWRDRTRYRQKRNQAIFVGSTTGETLTLDTVRRLATPRLRAAQAFRNSRRVIFQLPNVVQCDSEETAAAARALGFGETFVSWPEQMRYRHILSIDGNGATCSRVAVALHSNGTLVRYESDYELFYFKGLQPWVHFVPVAQDADVEAVVADSEAYPRRYAKIARAGRSFFSRHLRRGPCQRYVAALLQGYVDMLDGR